MREGPAGRGPLSRSCLLEASRGPSPAREAGALASPVSPALHAGGHCSASPHRASVTVTDSGPGIELGDRERIFDRLYSKKSAAAERAGAGLGLSIARSIARDHGGELIALDAPAPGTTFELTLPLAPPNAG